MQHACPVCFKIFDSAVSLGPGSRDGEGVDAAGGTRTPLATPDIVDGRMSLNGTVSQY